MALKMKKCNLKNASHYDEWRFIYQLEVRGDVEYKLKNGTEAAHKGSHSAGVAS